MSSASFKSIMIASVAGASCALAQDSLDPLVVSGLRTDLPGDEVPYTFGLIDSTAMSDSKRRTLPEALQFTPGVLVQKTAHGHGSPFIRGFTGRQNLLLVDGVRFNNALTRGGPVQYWNTVDPYSLERLEVIKGQGSVLYGSDSIGGTVNAITRSTGFRDMPEGEFFNHGSAYYEYRNNGEGSRIGRIESSTGVGGKYGILLGVTGKDFGDIQDSGIGRMSQTGYPEQDFDFKFELALNPEATMTFLHQYVNQDNVWRWHSTIYNPGWQHDGSVATPGLFNSRIYDQERSLTYLRFDGEPTSVAWLDRWSVTVSYQSGSDSELQDRRPSPVNPGAVDRRYQTANIDTLGFDLTLESPVGPGVLIYGFDYYHDSVDSAGYHDTGGRIVYRPDFRPVADNSEYDLLGAFAQYVWRPVSNLEITAGGRYTHAEAELGRAWNSDLGADVLGQSRSWDNFSGSLRFLWDIDDEWSLYGGISQAFRAPNLNDLSGTLTTNGNIPNTGSITTDPEKFLLYELGARYRNGSVSVGAAVFYTDAEDLIVRVPIANGSANQVTTNAADAYVYGFEIDGEWRFADDWLLTGFVAWQDGRTDPESFVGGPTIHDISSRMAPLTGSIALRWTRPDGRVWVEGRVLAADRQNDIELTAATGGDSQRRPPQGTPGYITCLIYAGWQATDWLELTGGVENIFDEDYRVHGSGVNEAGLNGILAAKLTW